MRLILSMILGISLFLSGCENDSKVIKMDGTYNIKCEGLESTVGNTLIVTIGKNVTIQYQYIGKPGNGLIVAKQCKIE